jgi:hypothetical protein
VQRELVPEQARFLRGHCDLPCHKATVRWGMEPITRVPEQVAALAALSDDELVERVKDLARCERHATVALIRSLMEFDARRLYFAKAVRHSSPTARTCFTCRKDRRTTESKRHERRVAIRRCSRRSPAAT